MVILIYGNRHGALYKATNVYLDYIVYDRDYVVNKSLTPAFYFNFVTYNDWLVYALKYRQYIQDLI